MIVAISAHQFDLTEDLRLYVLQKLVESIKPVVDNPATHLNVTLSLQESASADTGNQCRVHLAVPGQPPIVVHKLSLDMYAAIDLTHDTLLELVHEASGRIHDKHHLRVAAQKHRAEVARHVLTTRDDAVS